MPEEPLIDDGGMPYNAYLCEIRSIGGLSGSPGFVMVRGTEKGFREVGGSHTVMVGPNNELIAILLLGIVRSHWDLNSSTSAVDFAEDFDSKMNMGIAAITPIEEVQELIANDPELRAQRRQKAQSS